jgi:peptidoglycan/xylan/chitin deacetylase (PgdA/CDA1 family)
LLRLWQRALARAFGVVTAVQTTEPVIALTFDDGPHPEWTPQLLDLLRRYDAKATFFLLGAMAERHPDIVDRMVREGHAVGNHSWNHPSLPTVSLLERWRQYGRTRVVLGERAGSLARPPFGDLDWTTRFLLLIMGFRIVCWNVSSSDWESHDGAWFDRVFERQLRPGSIVLMHDQLFVYSSTDEPSRAEPFAALERLLASGRFRCVTVPALLELGKPMRRTWLKGTEPAVLGRLVSYAGLGYGASPASSDGYRVQNVLAPNDRPPGDANELPVPAPQDRLGEASQALGQEQHARS